MSVTHEDVIAVVRKANVVADPNKLRNELKLSEQGIDSLGVFNVLLLIEEQYELKIPDADIDRLSSISEIVDYLNQRLV